MRETWNLILLLFVLFLLHNISLQHLWHISMSCLRHFDSISHITTEEMYCRFVSPLLSIFIKFLWHPNRQFCYILMMRKQIELKRFDIRKTKKHFVRDVDKAHHDEKAFLIALRIIEFRSKRDRNARETVKNRNVWLMSCKITASSWPVF